MLPRILNARLARKMRVLVIATALLVSAVNGYNLLEPVVAVPVLQQPARFLFPPYYGTTTVTSVFDHEYPTYGNPPNNNFPDVVHYDNTRNGAGSRSSYNGHNGIDYALRYELVRAAAPGDVIYAGWNNAANHRAGYGLYVNIAHTNGFHTIYGHMSVLRVQTGNPIPASDEFQRILGRSGNTGYCAGWEGTGKEVWPGVRECTDNDPPTCGAHLHFHLEQADNERPVNPYGWIGATADPWSQRPDGATSVNRWVCYPSITNGDVYPSGAPLTAPPIGENESGYVTVDDGSTNYSETAGCWTEDDTAGWAGDHRHRDVPGSDCTATWNFPASQTAGRYHVFVHIPNDNVAPGNRRATVDAARYLIHHATSRSQPGEKQPDIAIVNQWAYPNNAYTSTWVYAGAYYFNSQYGTDYVLLESETLSSTGTLAADAVRFAPVVYRTYLPLVLKRWPPIPDIPVLNAIANPDHDGNYRVSWQWADLADTYLLQEATNAAFSGAVTRYSGTGTLWTATNKALDSYYYRVKARNSWGDSGWSNVRQTTVLPPAGWQTIASQNFEGAFPGEWSVFDNNKAIGGDYKWSKRTCRPYAGSYSGWGVGGGADGAALACGSDYPHDADSWLYYGPFDLEDAIAGELVFKLWSYTELYDDYVSYVASVDGLHFDGGYRISGNTHGWNDVVLDLADVPNLGNLLGKSHVWVALIFASNSSVNYAEGGYVDDVVIRKCFRGFCPSGSQGLLAPGGGAVREVSATMIRNR